MTLFGFRSIVQPRSSRAEPSGYRKNRYRFDRSLIDKVDRNWGFAVREWGYEPPNAND